LALLQLKPRHSLSVLIAVFGIDMFGGPEGPAQTANPNSTEKNFTPGMDISLGAFGQITGTRIPTTTTVEDFGISVIQKTQGTSPLAGVLGTFHQSFKPWLGYNVNVGYTRFAESYSYGAAFIPSQSSTFKPFASFSQGSIETNMYELTIASVVAGPRNRRFSTFGQFGGGGLFFIPTQSHSPASQQTRPAMVFGAGMNYKLTSHIDVRAEYRGLFYKSPDFAYYSRNFPITKLFTVTNMPTVSLVYRFGGAKKPRYPTKSH